MARNRLLSFIAALVCVVFILFIYFCFGDGPAEGLPASSSVAPADFVRLFDDTIMHRITINIAQSEWDGLIQDMKDYGKIDARMKTQNYRLADFLYEDEYGKVEIKDVGFRTRGSSTRVIPEDDEGNYYRSHFAVRFNETFDAREGTDRYEKLHYREFCGLEKLNLKWNLWSDESHIRELYCYERLGAAGLMAPKASLCALTLNIGDENIYYGVYTMIEPVDKAFLSRRFGSQNNDGNLYKCMWENVCAALSDDYSAGSIGIKDWKTNYRPAYDLKTNKDTPDTSDIKSFIKNINDLNDEDFSDYIDRTFDVDGFLRLLAMDTLLGECDDYRTMGNNYYLYFNNGGKAVMIPYDYDSTLGGGWNGEPYWTYEGIATADIYKWRDLAAIALEQDVPRPLLDRILDIKEYRDEYAGYLERFIEEGIVSYQSFLDKFNALESLYGKYTNSATRYNGEVMRLTNEEWYFATKIASVREQLG